MNEVNSSAPESSILSKVGPEKFYTKKLTLPKSFDRKEYNRNENLDFVKGFLVIIMVLYHAMNYFVFGSNYLYKFTYFVSGAFIFISGYKIGLRQRINSENDHGYFYINFIVRGLKILVLFSFLNVSVHSFFITNFNGAPFSLKLFFENFLEIYTVGGKGRLTVFEILLPIAYLYMLSPLIFLLTRKRGYLIITVTLPLTLLGTLAQYPMNNLGMLLVGLNGYSLGRITSPVLITGKKSRVAFPLFLIIRLALWNNLNRDLFSYSVTILLWVASAYIIGTVKRGVVNIKKFFIMQGQYSLLGYLLQILVLQIIYRLGLFEKKPLSWELFLIVGVIVIFLIAFCFLVNEIRARFHIVDIIYKFVF